MCRQVRTYHECPKCDFVWEEEDVGNDCPRAGCDGKRRDENVCELWIDFYFNFFFFQDVRPGRHAGLPWGCERRRLLAGQDEGQPRQDLPPPLLYPGACL